MSANVPGKIDSYIAAYPPDIARRLSELRSAIRQAAPNAEEAISYGMPAYRLDGTYVVYFGGWKKHIAVYPLLDMPPDIEAELAPYRKTRGTLTFPHGREIPYGLLQRAIAARLAQISATA